MSTTKTKSHSKGKAVHGGHRDDAPQAAQLAAVHRLLEGGHFEQARRQCAALPGDTRLWLPRRWCLEADRLTLRVEASPTAQALAAMGAHFSKLDAHAQYLRRVRALGDTSSRARAEAILQQRATRGDEDARRALEAPSDAAG